MATDTTGLAKTALIEALEKLRDDVRSLAEPLTEEELWRKPLNPSNSVGHLLLHLSGNLDHFVGGQLGGTGYVRDREREFTETQVPSKTEALQKLDDAVATFRKVVSGLSAEQLAAPHPEARFGTVMSALTHLLAHFALHRGQMSYIVRLVRSPLAA
ncbi:MAG TPA: DinB family protein [Gemmataceae bacterium]|nr:DinB family protein [Gemmataceae bacterium]